MNSGRITLSSAGHHQHRADASSGSSILFKLAFYLSLSLLAFSPDLHASAAADSMDDSKGSNDKHTDNKVAKISATPFPTFDDATSTSDAGFDSRRGLTFSTESSGPIQSPRSDAVSYKRAASGGTQISACSGETQSSSSGHRRQL